MFCDVSKDGPIFFLLRSHQLFYLLLSDDLSKNCQWCHHNFLCIVISSREGGRILPKKKEKEQKNTYVAESMTFFIYNSVTCIIFRNKQKQLGSLGARRLSSIYLDVAQILTKLMTELQLKNYERLQFLPFFPQKKTSKRGLRARNANERITSTKKESQSKRTLEE